MAVMATIAGIPRLLSNTTPSTSTSSSSCSHSVPPASPPISSFSPSHQFASTRRLDSLHVANFARNIVAERKGAAVSPPESEMSAADLKKHEESCFKLEGLQPDFWEGSMWNGLGFTIQYMWLFGVAVSIVACITAVRTYNLGSTDFKQTEVFKEAIQYQVDESNGSAIFDESAGLSIFDKSSQEAP